jgi:uncharacterized OsmC-like protein
MGSSGAINGVSLDRLREIIKAFRAMPSLARFRFRAANRWLGGGHSVTTMKNFFGAGREDSSRESTFEVHADEPAVLLGADRGANPVEHILAALASCLTTSLVYHAAAGGITVEEVESELEGDVDVRGFLGLTPGVRKGFERIRVRVRVKSDASAEQLRALMQDSPVYDVISNPVPIFLELEKK